MRCRNCGWDNPGGNVKCEKCNAPLNDGFVDDRTPQQGYAPDSYSSRPTVAHIASDDFNPRPTVAGIAADDFNPRPTVAGRPADDFNPHATITGCPSCGYPVRPDDTECPVCGIPNAGAKKEPEVEKQVSKSPVSVGTIIRGANFEKEKTDNTARKKLTGFLVTFSHSPNGQFFPLYEGKNFVGRSAKSTVSIQDDSSISENHLSILYRTVDKKFKFKDEQSSNGTFVNGELIDEGVLKNNDMIRLGATLLLFMEIPFTSFE